MIPTWDWLGCSAFGTAEKFRGCAADGLECTRHGDATLIHSSVAAGYHGAAMSDEGIVDFQARRVRGDASAQGFVESSLRRIEALNPSKTSSFATIGSASRGENPKRPF